MKDISVLTLELPKSVKAVTLVKEKGEYIIVLNSLYEEKYRKKIFKQERLKLQTKIKNV